MRCRACKRCGLALLLLDNAAGIQMDRRIQEDWSDRAAGP
jgi:hypothetical protein